MLSFNGTGDMQSQLRGASDTPVDTNRKQQPLEAADHRQWTQGAVSINFFGF